MATGSKTAKAFKVICPFCGNADETVRIDLNNLTECECSGCNETFSPKAAVEKAAEHLRQWQAVARWVEAAGEMMAE